MGKYQILVDSLYFRTIHIYIKNQKLTFTYNCKSIQQRANYNNMLEFLALCKFSKI